MSCGHRLDYETLDFIDEVWRSQDQKIELSCFSQNAPTCRNFPDAIRPVLSVFYNSREYLLLGQAPFLDPLPDISRAYGFTYFPDLH